MSELTMAQIAAAINVSPEDLAWAVSSAAIVQGDLTFQHLEKVSRDRALRWHPGGISDWSANEWAVATIGELGEACNVLKKLNRARDGIVGNDKTQEELQAQFGEELADTVCYLVLLAARCDIDLSAEIVAKFNKVSKKYGFPERLKAKYPEGP